MLGPISPRAELHTGTFQLFPGGGWDFSEPTTNASPDFAFDVTAANKSNESALGFIELLTPIPPALIYYVGNQEDTYDDLIAAPTNLSLYKTNEFGNLNEVFVVYTREGHFAKMRITAIGTLMSFEYTYQDDGSEILSITTPVEETTWGRVKALYR
jgi:hypothetical protein